MTRRDQNLRLAGHALGDGRADQQAVLGRHDQIAPGLAGAQGMGRDPDRSLVGTLVQIAGLHPAMTDPQNRLIAVVHRPQKRAGTQVLDPARPGCRLDQRVLRETGRRRGGRPGLGVVTRPEAANARISIARPGVEDRLDPVVIGNGEDQKRLAGPEFGAGAIMLVAARIHDDIAVFRVRGDDRGDEIRHLRSRRGDLCIVPMTKDRVMDQKLVRLIVCIGAAAECVVVIADDDRAEDRVVHHDRRAVRPRGIGQQADAACRDDIADRQDRDRMFHGKPLCCRSNGPGSHMSPGSTGP